MAEYTIHVLNDIGNTRQQNEDNFYCNGMYRKDLSCPGITHMEKCEGTRTVLVAVFDGMGGETAGDKASYYAAEQLRQLDLNSDNKDLSLFVNELNTTVCNIAENYHCRVGSTAVLAKIENEFLTVCSVGDSRAYMFRDMSLVQMTEDHTEEASYIKMRKALNLPIEENACKRNALTQHLGIREDEFLLGPSVSKDIKVKKGDIYLLCSDGLTHYVNDLQITKVLNEKIGGEDKVRLLRDEAFRCGNADNITVILIEVA